jgi:steroid 5-alpha reductase family enzyme
VLFQAAAMLSWSSTLLPGGWPRRAVGVFGSVSAVVLSIALLLAPAKLTTHLLMMGIGLQVIWYLGLAALLARRTVGD